MSYFDPKKTSVALNGVPMKKHGTDFIAKITKSDDRVNTKVGKKGDKILEINYGVVESISFTLQYDSPVRAQVLQWEKNHEPISVIYSDDNNGFVANGTGMIASTGDISDDDDLEIMITCDQLDY